MKPKGSNPNEQGLIEYLEDIIGCDKYISRITEAGAEVETVQEEVQFKLNRVKMVEKDRDKLVGAKEEAEDYIRNEMQIFKMEAIKCQISINMLSKSQKVKEQDLQAITEEIERKTILQSTVPLLTSQLPSSFPPPPPVPFSGYPIFCTLCGRVYPP